jgi:hypothetical protein
MRKIAAAVHPRSSLRVKKFAGITSKQVGITHSSVAEEP